MGLAWGNNVATGVCWNGNTGVSAMYNGQLVWPTAAEQFSEVLLWRQPAGAAYGSTFTLASAGSAFPLLKVVYGVYTDLSGSTSNSNKCGAHEIYIDPNRHKSGLYLGKSFYPGNSGNYRMYANYQGIMGSSWTRLSGGNSNGSQTIASGNSNWIFIGQVWGIK